MQSQYKKYFKKDHWGKIAYDVIDLLERESVVITGIPSSGKRYFLRHLFEYFNEISNKKNTVLAKFEITSIQVTLQDIKKALTDSISAKFPPSVVSIEEKLQYLTSRGKEVFFFINNFNRLKGKKDINQFFDSLRTIDEFHIHFCIGCDMEILINPSIYSDVPSLMLSNIITLKPFTKETIQNVIINNNERYKWNTDLKQIDQIYKLTGGVPGLVKYTQKHLHISKEKGLNLDALLNHPGLFVKLGNIITKLKRYKFLNKDNSFEEEHIPLLIDLGILNSKEKIRIGLLRKFLSVKDPNDDSWFLKNLSKQEYSIFEYMKRNLGKIVTIEEVSKVLWKEYDLEKFSPWAIYKAISNLNKKIKKYGYYIKNYRGRGYSLVKCE